MCVQNYMMKLSIMCKCSMCVEFITGIVSGFLVLFLFLWKSWRKQNKLPLSFLLYLDGL